MIPLSSDTRTACTYITWWKDPSPIQNLSQLVLLALQVSPFKKFCTSLCDIDYLLLLSFFPCGQRTTSTSGKGLQTRPFQQHPYFWGKCGQAQAVILLFLNPASGWWNHWLHLVSGPFTTELFIFFNWGFCMQLRVSSMQRLFHWTEIAVFVCDWDNKFYLIYSHCFHSFMFKSLWGRLENFGQFARRD